MHCSTTSSPRAVTSLSRMCWALPELSRASRKPPRNIAWKYPLAATNTLRCTGKLQWNQQQCTCTCKEMCTVSHAAAFLVSGSLRTFSHQKFPRHKPSSYWLLKTIWCEQMQTKCCISDVHTNELCQAMFNQPLLDSGFVHWVQTVPESTQRRERERE